MISKYGRRLLTPAINRIAGWLHKTGITPNVVSMIGFSLTALDALLLAQGYFLLGGLLLAIVSFSDMVDGSLARLTRQSSKFGAFIDSTLDRYSESVTLLALAYALSHRPNSHTEILLIFITLVGSLMVSYTRARAEALDIECKVGLMQRPERIILLCSGLISGWLTPALWLLAILTNFTVLQRIHAVYLGTPATSPIPPTPTSNSNISNHQKLL